MGRVIWFSGRPVLVEDHRQKTQTQTQATTSPACARKNSDPTGVRLQIAYLRKIDLFTFEELLLEGFESHGFRTIRNKRYTGDGGIDGQVIIGKHRYLIQAKRYRGHIALQHVQEFDTLLKRHNCRGLFCHTGKTGAASKAVSFASDRMEIISGQRLIDLLTPGSSFTIATAPQTMMRRTAATRGTNIIVEGKRIKNTTDSMRVN